MGLQPLTSVFEQFARADRLLVLTSQAFDFPADSLPANVRYVGPQLDDPAWLGLWEPAPSGDDDLPLVLVSLSTTYQQQADVVRRVVAALADLPIRGLVTLGPALDGKQFTLPPNVRAEPYAPHILVCPHADLVITHGGHGTVITALSAGVPLVCLPMGRDQGDNAARVVWRGAGVRCSSKVDEKTLRRAIQQVLGQPRFREGARRIADGIARDGGPSQAIAELEDLASPLALVSE
jgi:MGT family glycosyltransferase